MKVIWAVISESSSTDRESNNVSLFNILEEVHFPEPPDESIEPGTFHIAPLRFLLMVLFARSDYDEGENHTCRLAVFCPNSPDPDILPEFGVDLETAHRVRTKLNIGGIPLRGEGEYRFEVQLSVREVHWQSIAEVPLRVSYLQQE